ncbi:MAG: DUF1015 domain-containing protein [Candidatus Omnitrophica bacterium]|nr:DUF1015 domain-containing protein [Candidatus Omnitrophota bacterium]
MSSIRPFRAVYYNQDKVEDLSNVVCPPYDIISEEEQNVLTNLSPYNFIHVLLGKDQEGDDKKNNKYRRAKKIYNEWLDEKILIQDAKPSIYFYRQEYTIQGQRHSRKGFIALMELQDEEDSRIRPHENTHSKAIEDRLKLWTELNSNLSCIFVCYADRQKRIDKIFIKNVIVNAPIVDIEDNDGVRHIVWRLDDANLIREISGSLLDQHLFIADGHHRYKVAMEFRHSKLSGQTGLDGTEPQNFLMTYFTNIDSKDLKIFPMHRIVKNMPKDIRFLDEFFRIDKVKTKEDLVILLARAGRNEHAFGLYTRDGIRLLRLKNKLLIDQYVKEGSKDYKSLDATILKYFVFDRVGIKSDDIIYTKDLHEATGLVENGSVSASFIMNAVKISQLKAIALNDEKMPPKTTYFYPKVLSGLTVYNMDV